MSIPSIFLELAADNGHDPSELMRSSVAELSNAEAEKELAALRAHSDPEARARIAKLEELAAGKASQPEQQSEDDGGLPPGESMASYYARAMRSAPHFTA